LDLFSAADASFAGAFELDTTTDLPHLNLSPIERSERILDYLSYYFGIKKYGS
jgi:hypothetical protein